MDYSCTQESGRVSSSQTRHRVWSPTEKAALVDILKDMVNEGCRADGFRQGYSFEIERRLKLKFPNCTLCADPHISSKIHVWRKNYVSVALIKGNLGFGWNEITKTFSCDDPVWIVWLKVVALVLLERICTYQNLELDFLITLPISDRRSPVTPLPVIRRDSSGQGSLPLGRFRRVAAAARRPLSCGRLLSSASTRNHAPLEVSG
ncbi:Unknown protein [Striga hermonthica]|uniref:Myb/SANT-like domain-containing protein n=1 Tax=Striga hermonthica TaxID=68872 RepID=A0A9N7MQJ1_STRHE|nr:Unknown protein [Striga hermonthica]